MRRPIVNVSIHFIITTKLLILHVMSFSCKIFEKNFLVQNSSPTWPPYHMVVNQEVKNRDKS